MKISFLSRATKAILVLSLCCVVWGSNNYYLEFNVTPPPIQALGVCFNHNDALVTTKITMDEEHTTKGTLVAIQESRNVLKYALSKKPQHGFIEVLESSEFTLQLEPDFYGSDSFEFAVYDGHGGEARQTVAIVANKKSTRCCLFDFLR